MDEDRNMFKKIGIIQFFMAKKAAARLRAFAK